jgi:hypothetical protein
METIGCIWDSHRSAIPLPCPAPSIPTPASTQDCADCDEARGHAEVLTAAVYPAPKLPRSHYPYYLGISGLIAERWRL